LSKPLLSIRNLSKSFDSVQALNEASFNVLPNKVNLLIGANGSGKTTLINAVSGIVSADAGSVVFCGDNITHHSPDKIYLKGMSRTFQNPRLFANLSVLENLLIVSNGADKFRHTLHKNNWSNFEDNLTKKALQILDSLQLLPHKDKLAYDMSGGQIKLLELAKTLMTNAKLILLDEPIAGVNPVLAHKIFDNITHTKITFLIIEHRLDIALQYADHVFVMDKGSIIADDTPQKILEKKTVRESYLGQ